MPEGYYVQNVIRQVYVLPHTHRKMPEGYCVQNVIRQVYVLPHTHRKMPEGYCDYITEHLEAREATVAFAIGTATLKIAMTPSMTVPQILP